MGASGARYHLILRRDEAEQTEEMEIRRMGADRFTAWFNHTNVEEESSSKKLPMCSDWQGTTLIDYKMGMGYLGKLNSR